MKNAPNYSRLSILKINVWQSIEQRTIDTTIDQWDTRLKICIRAESRHFKHMW